MKKTSYVLILSIIIFSFFVWFSVSRAIFIPLSLRWVALAIWFSLLFIALCLGSILIKKKQVLYWTTFLSFLLSLLFAADWSRPVFLSIAGLMFWWGSSRIRKDVRSNIQIDLRKSVNQGKNWIIASIFLVIASQYFSTVKNLNVGEIFPGLQPTGLPHILTTFLPYEIVGIPLVPMVAAAIFFLTSIPAGNIISIFLMFIINLIFKILVRFNVVMVAQETKQVEVIEQI